MVDLEAQILPLTARIFRFTEDTLLAHSHV